MRNAYKVSIGNSVRKSNLGDLDIDDRIVLTLILKRHRVRLCTGFFWIRIRSRGGFL